MSPQMRKMLIIVGIVFGLVFGWYGAKKVFIGYMISHYVPPPVYVSSSVATTKTWQPFLTSVGTLKAVNGVDISAEVPGIVSDIHFQSGQLVNKGDILVSLNTNVEEAQLKNDEAQLKLSQLNYDRDQILQKKNVISQSMFDRDLAQLSQAQANVEGTQARIKEKTITAPFSGRIGIRLINLGEFVQAGTAMVTLQSMDPLYVQFNLPEQYLSDLYLQQPIDVSINLSGGQFIQGTISAINSKVDQTTRNILVQAVIPNKSQQLLPGMFGLVKIWLRTQSNVVVLPETAVSYSLHGDSVFIIKEEGKDKDKKPLLKAYRQYVTVGEHRDGFVSIVKGIQPGQQVVTSGQLKLQNGTHIAIDNSVEL